LTETFTSSTDSKIRDGAKYEESDTRRRMSPNSGPRRLRELLKQPGIIRSLGAHDVIADGDTGYGDLHNVQRTVEAFEAAGTSGILTGGPSDVSILPTFRARKCC
jgi:2-methylisocitrate lyase-like PEP mutase family enzyme